MVSSEPTLRIGYCLSLTGPLAGNSRSAQLAHEIWCENVNARGGLLGRRVELLCYDDEADSTKVPELYRRLLEDDKVDLVVGGYGTNTVAPALPLMMKLGRYFVGLMGLGANNELAYANYFAMIPTGGDPNASLTEGFFALGAAQTPRPATVALVSADAAFARNPILGAKANAAKYGFDVVHESTYSLATQDFTSVVDAVASSKCDLLFLCSYLQDSIGLVRAICAHDFKPKLVGASMIGPQNAAVKTELGPLLNGFVNYEYWQPQPKLEFAGVSELLRTYQARAMPQGVDALGHYMAPLAYAQMQVLEQAIVSTGGIDDAQLSEYTRTHTFKTVMGEVSFGKNGEWTTPRVLQVQFQGIAGHDVEQFRNGSRQVTVHPNELASGSLIYPYGKVA